MPVPYLFEVKSYLLELSRGWCVAVVISEDTLHWGFVVLISEDTLHGGLGLGRVGGYKENKMFANVIRI